VIALGSCPSTNTWALDHLDELSHGACVWSPHHSLGRIQLILDVLLGIKEALAHLLADILGRRNGLAAGTISTSPQLSARFGAGLRRHKERNYRTQGYPCKKG
jgi:hypothetical protein